MNSRTTDHPSKRQAQPPPTPAIRGAALAVGGLAALFAATVLFCAGCATSPSTATPARHFHEASRVNVVLQFSSWEYTFMVQPRYDENGFLRSVRREELGRILDEFHAPREMAVVVIGWTYGPKEINGLVDEWKTVLGGCGFRRAVFVRPNVHDKLNGSLIIDDSILSFASAQAASPTPGAAP
jgi:hypothetical protein